MKNRKADNCRCEKHDFISCLRFMQIGRPSAMMLAFETRCRQLQLGVQGYCSLQEDQRPPFLHLKIKSKQITLEKVIATKASCQMQFELITVRKHIRPQTCQRVYKGLMKAEVGKDQLQYMAIFLGQLQRHMGKWKESLCQKCRPIFLRYDYPWIQGVRTQMKRLIEDLVQPGERAQYFKINIGFLNTAIKMFQKDNQCITIPRRTKTQQGTESKKELSDEECQEQPPKKRDQYTNQQPKIEEE